MKKIFVTAPDKVELADVPGPSGVGPDEVAGPTLASVVSAGTELHSYGRDGSEKRKYPCALGYGAVFRAERTGANVKDVRPGDILFTSGPHASEQHTARANAIRVPPGLPPEKAVLTRMMGVSWTTLITARARPPAKVIVTGLGPVGHLAAQMVRASAFDVLAVDPDPVRRRFAEEKGLNVAARIPLDDPHWAGQVHLVVECSGHESAVLDACSVVRKRGEVVLVGVPWVRRTDLYAHEILYKVFYNFVDIRSGWEWELPSQSQDFSPCTRHDVFAAGMNWLASGRVNVDGIYHLFDPPDAQAVYADLQRGHAEYVVYVYDWTHT